MPQFKAALLCDYVKDQGGTAHLISAGIDTVHASQVPAGANLGLYALMKFTRNECGRPHRIEGIFQTEDGQRLVQLSATLTPQWREDLPLGWLAGAQVVLNFGLPLPQYGLYSLEILLNDNSVESLPLRVIPQPAPNA